MRKIGLMHRCFTIINATIKVWYNLYDVYDNYLINKNRRMVDKLLDVLLAESMLLEENKQHPTLTQ